MPDSTTLATVLFTDIVGSTEIAADMGDRRWQELLRRHHAMVRQELRRSGGREIDTAGDGFFATFPRPAAAIRCAWAIGDRLRELGVEVRAGVHTGEVEVRGRSVGGIAVHIGSRVAGTAGPGEIVVTSTVRDLVSGSGFDFEHRGIQPLKGVPGTWPLFSVTGAEGKQRPAPPKAEVARERRQAIEAPSVVRRRPWLGGIAAALVVALVVAVLALGDEDAPPTPTGIQPGTAVQVDPETGKVLATVTGLPGTTGPSPGPIAVGEGGVWVYIYPHLIHVDPLHHSIEAIIPSGFATTVEVGFHQIWLASTRHKGITRINPADNESLPPIDLRFPASDTPSASDNATGMAVGEGAVWETWGSGHLIRVDPRQGRVERINLDANLYGVAAGEGSVWVGDQLSGSIIPVDPRSHEPRQPIDLFGNIDAIAAGEGQVWVLDRGASTVTPIDVSVGRPEPPIDVGDNPTDMDIGLGFLWVSDESGTITRIDALTHHKEEFDFGTPIASIAVDLDTGSLWALASEHMPVF